MWKMIAAGTVIACLYALGCESEPQRAKAPAPKRTTLRGYIDKPEKNAKVTGQLQVVGWALDDEGQVRRVEVLVDDGVYEAKLGRRSEGLCKTYPKRPACAAAGFETAVAEVRPGRHTVVARLTNDRGETLYVGKREFQVQ